MELYIGYIVIFPLTLTLGQYHTLPSRDELFLASRPQKCGALAFLVSALYAYMDLTSKYYGIFHHMWLIHGYPRDVSGPIETNLKHDRKQNGQQIHRLDPLLETRTQYS